MFVSSFGGKTANTEFEVLTGNSIAFLPPSATPYQIFVKSELPNLNTALKNLGYDNTVGMHPFKATSYNRKLVYKLFGFDKQLFIDDFDEAGTARGTRHLISDDADIDRVIQEYEEARASTLNAHYTSPTVIKAIYEAANQMRHWKSWFPTSKK